MKKIGIFLVVLFMGLLIFVRSPAPAHADAWVLPFNKLYDVIEMAQTLFSGGKLEFSQIIDLTNPLDDILDMWDDFRDRLAASATAKRTADTFNLLADLARSGTSIIESNTSDVVLPFTFDDVGAFVQYNPLWYLQNIAIVDENPIATPDPNYIAYLNRINLRDDSDPTAFWFYNVPQHSEANSNVYLISYPVSAYSWISYDSTFNQLNNFSTPYCIASNLISIYIYNNNGVYSYSVSGTGVSATVGMNGSNDIWNLASFRLNNGYGSTFNLGGNGNSTPYNFSRTYSDSDLGIVLFDISQHFKNVNIYVDDVLWSWAGDVVLPPILGPDVINIGNTDDITYDVYGLEQPDDLGLDIPNFIDWILTKLQEGASTISLDDAITDEVPLVKTVDGVRAIDYEDTRPIERVIEITLDDPDPNPSPTPNPDDPTPPILKLPTFNMIPAPHETTVLSELIDATQKTVPEELMNLIWNCFGLLVIGGLIYILHK